MLIPVKQINEAAARYYDEPSIAEKFEPDVIAHEDLVVGAAEPPSADKLTVDQNLEKRKDMLAALAQEPVDFAFERAIGNNDSVYSNFCEFILLAKRKVGRIVVKDGNQIEAYATGFMVSDRLMLTNWHVFRTMDEVGNSEVAFFYELDVQGHPTTATIFKLAADDFYYSNEELDYCFVAVDPKDISGKTELTSIGYHYLDPKLGKLGEEGKEKLNIIHHPDGDYKQLSIRENTFTKILENTIWYETDTAPGSSGSPVFNDQWQVVALHHSGVPKMTDDGKNYADKDGNPILPVNGKIDAARVVWKANEGVRISKVLEDVSKAFPNNQFVKGLQKPGVPGTVPESDGTPLATGIKRRPMVRERVGEDKPMQNQDTNDVRIAFPAALIEANGNININISNRGGMSAALPGPAKLQPSLNGGSEQDDLDEVKKLDIENSFDYSDCKGYDPNFLGVKIPLPKPKGKMLKFVAKLKSGNGSILDYYYFSTIHHSVRKMPMISGINVDGDPELRIDTFKRKDVWLRDNRLDYEMQLDDAFYKTSGFDKGHMSRREDADYGTSGELAKKFADLTCIYTNACPQVPELNRSNKKGLWGKLEEVVLEKGADLEKGQFAKISVFNGPIFDDDNDRFFRSVQIPMQFFKIIVWFNEAKKLQATAFKLSQENLVGGIDFEKLDFDTNAQFKEFQVSLSSLEKLTGLDLSDIKPFDTFKAADPDETLRIDSEEALRSLVDKAFVTTT